MNRIQHLVFLTFLASFLTGCPTLEESGGGPTRATPEKAPVATTTDTAKQSSRKPVSTAATERPTSTTKVVDEAELVKTLDNSQPLRPFIVASSAAGSLSVRTTATVTALQGAGFEIAGQYSPFDGTNIIVATNGELKRIAARSARGGYAAGQRISVTETDGNVEVAYINPVYIQYAYHLLGDLQPVLTRLTEALGMQESCGADKNDITALKLWKYHYMMGMQYFDDPYELGSFSSHASAVTAVENGLSKQDDALIKVYRIDIPGTRQTVFGVGMKSTGEDDRQLDSAYQMTIVDFEGCKKRAYFPYEILVNDKSVEALHMRFRMAVHFPNLSMMGSHGFTKLMSAPGQIETALKDMVGAK